MPSLDLTDDQAATLADILEEYLSDLRMEIADTDRKDYREELKTKKAFLQEMLERLGAEVG